MMSIMSQVKVRKSHHGSHVGTNGIGIITCMKTVELSQMYGKYIMHGSYVYDRFHRDVI